MEAHMKDLLNRLFGLGFAPQDLDYTQLAARTIVVFCLSLVLIRLAGRRFLSHMNAVDALLGFVLGSLLARAINGSGPFLGMLFAATILVVLHRFISMAMYRYPRFGNVVKGKEVAVIRDGVCDDKVRHHHLVTLADLREGIRLNGHVEDFSLVEKAVIERSGAISVVQHTEKSRKSPPGRK
jgi:uncharacterized membrane protein YcaP (DUF421 family)